MNAILQSQLDRVEAALNTLTDSITSYNPSVPAAIDLLAADDELITGLELLATHQSNHTKILTLRTTATALDAQIKSILTLLAATRTELLATPATVFPPAARDVPYAELLAYAKRISKFTVPPPALLPRPEKDQVPLRVSGEEEQGRETEANGVDGGGDGDGGGGVGGAPDADAAVTAGNGGARGIGVSALAAGESQWLDPGAQMPFVPWPTEEVIRRGALARIQVMLEQGVDPAGADDAVREETKLEMTQEMELEVDHGIKHEGVVVEPVRKESTSAGLGRVDLKRDEKPAVFGGLDLYDPDDE